jgi:uncharacterized damage-inducible protein DinB
MIAEFPQPTQRDEVLANIRRARAELEASFAGLSEQQMTGPATEGGWTIKDHLAHITEYQRRALAVIAGHHQADGFGVDRDTFEQFADVHAVNEFLFQRNRDRDLSDVIDDFRETYRLVEATVEQMNDTDMHRELSGTLAERFPRVVDLINFNIARHDRVHIKDIQALAEHSVSDR